MKLRLLTGNDVRCCLGMPRAIDAMSRAFAALSSKQVEAPHRTKIGSSDGIMLYKPALQQKAGIFIVKVVSVFPGNLKAGLPVTTGLLLVNDATTGLPRALMDAQYLTALRTGAASGLACRLLCNPGVTQAALFGAGGQAACQLEAMLCTLPLETVYVFTRDSMHAEAFCRNQEPAAGGCRLIANPDRSVLKTCGVICTATTSSTPVFSDDEICAGTHINGIGSFMPTMAEIPAETICRSTVVVDQREACLDEAGDLRQPIERGLMPPDFRPAELGEIVLRRATGRTSPQAVTVFKSVGNAAQDLECAAEVLGLAEESKIGTMIEV